MGTEVREEIKAFWNKNGDYDNIAAHGVHSDEEKNLWMNVFKEQIGTGKRLKILDMGTGSGFLAFLLADMQHEVTGADWSLTMLEKAREKLKGKDNAVNFVTEDAEDLSFGAETFDTVVSRHMLWTLPDPQKVINEWSRVLKQGGQVIVDIPLKAVGKSHFNEEVGKELPFYNGTTTEEVAGMFEKAGFVNQMRSDFKGEDGKEIVIIKYEKPESQKD